MPNQQLFPQSTYPITGDVQSTPGAPNVLTVGFQGTGVVSTKPTDGQVYVYVEEIDKWVPADPVVSGPNAQGTAPTAPPVQVGGIDDANQVRELRVDSSGNVQLSDTNKILLLILQELRKQRMILESASGDSFEDEFIGA